jgi:transcriptional regulator with XRE-family HTH domain
MDNKSRPILALNFQQLLCFLVRPSKIKHVVNTFGIWRSRKRLVGQLFISRTDVGWEGKEELAFRRQYLLLTEEGRALALEVDTATSNLSRIEKGLRTPSLALIYRLEEAVGVTLS